MSGNTEETLSANNKAMCQKLLEGEPPYIIPEETHVPSFAEFGQPCEPEAGWGGIEEPVLLDEGPQEAIRLAKSYDCCLLGASVSLHGQDRFVYSLKKLIRFEKTRRQCTVAEAREAIADEFIVPMDRLHGEKGPVWLNDELVDGEISEDEKPLLVLPPNFKS